ncbi:MAG: SCO family protein, partial [Alphaproteobacteria bacterium]|nr:SCO family protein [Alphaproteobacteria bacterium]
HRGWTVTEESFLGQFLLIYFGYTHCPDVCPTDLQVITHAVEDLGEAGGHCAIVWDLRKLAFSRNWDRSSAW